MRRTVSLTVFEIEMEVKARQQQEADMLLWCTEDHEAERGRRESAAPHRLADRCAQESGAAVHIGCCG